MRLLTRTSLIKSGSIYIDKPSDVLYKLRPALLHAQPPFHRLKHYWIATLTGSNLVTQVELLGVGSGNYLKVDVADVFRTQLLNQAKKVIVFCSCYGKGKVYPTRRELAKALTLSQYGNFVGLPVIDFVIMSEDDHHSHIGYNTLHGYKAAQ